MTSAQDPPVYFEYLPMAPLTDDEITAACLGYFAGEAAGYDEFDRSVRRRAAYLRAVDDRVAAEISGLGRCDLVLSYGCGTGRRELDIAARSGFRPALLGVEPCAPMAEIAAARGVPSIPDLDAGGAPAPASVDAVLCLYTFFHLPRGARAGTLRRLAGLLRPGGLLALDVFHAHDRWGGGADPAPLARRIRDGDVLYRRIGAPHVSFMHYFTVAEIAGLIEDAGLTVTRIVGVGHGKDPGRIDVPLTEGCLLVTATRPG